MSDLRPTLGDVRLSHSMLNDPRVQILEDRPFRALMGMVFYVGSSLVWTYTPPGDGSLPDDDVRLARLTRLTPKQWKRTRPELEHFFQIRGGRWHLRDPWIEVVSAGRLGIPLAIQADVLRRQGQRCTYCGDLAGPFEFDHIFPVSRGGTNDASNITLACETCNRSKGARTLEEWKNGRR